MAHRPEVDRQRTTLKQLRIGFAWCTCGRSLALVDGRGWRHDRQRGRGVPFGSIEANA